MRPEWNIWKKVDKLCFLDGIDDEGSIQLLSELGFESYSRNLENGKTPKQAYKLAIASAKSEMRRRIGWSWMRTRYGNFSLLISLIMFLYSLGVMASGLVYPERFAFVAFPAYSVMLLLAFLFLGYAWATYRRRTLFDYILVVFFLVSTSVIAWYSFVYLRKISTGHYYYSAQYAFPGVISIFKHYRADQHEPETRTYFYRNIFDPTFLTTLACLLSALALKIGYCLKREKRRT